MSRRITLTQGDTRPLSVISMQDVLGNPLDVSNASDVVRLKLREIGSTTVKDTIVCNKLPGFLSDDGVTVDSTAPYDTPGKGGRIEVPWTSLATDTAGEFEGEVEITFGDGRVQTLPRRVPITVLEQM